MLISALRVGAEDKQGNDERCIKFANLLDKAEIKYIWLYFGNKPMKNEPANMHYCGLNLDIKPYIAKADYLVQLSGSEAFSYSLLESLECNTPVIVTPLAQNADMGIVDGENGFLCKAGDSDELAQIMKRISEMSVEEKIARIKAKAAKVAVKVATLATLATGVGAVSGCVETNDKNTDENKDKIENVQKGKTSVVFRTKKNDTFNS